MPKPGALMAFGLLTRSQESATSQERPRREPQESQPARAGSAGPYLPEGDPMIANESGWVRRGAAATAIGGLLMAGGATATALLGAAPQLLGALAAALLAVGIMVLYSYARRSKAYGALGRAGSDVIVASLTLIAIGGVVSGTNIALPVGLLVAVGSAMFGVAALRSGAFPRGGAVLVLVSSPIYFAAAIAAILGAQAEWLLPATQAVAGLGWTWIGAGLLSGRRRVADFIGSPVSG